MLDDLLDTAMSILFRILEQLAELAISQPFPDHRRLGRGKAPIRRSRRHVHAREVMVLVTGAASNRIYSAPVRSPSDLHRVLMAVISLTRKISGGMAVHASRMPQYGNDCLKGIRGGPGRFGLRSCIKCEQESRYGV
jgi:hypothetical protein